MLPKPKTEGGPEEPPQLPITRESCQGPAERQASSARGAAAVEIPGPVAIEQDLAAIAKWLTLIFGFLEAVARRDLEKLELKILIVLLLESWRCRCKFIWLHEDKILSGLTKIHSQNLTRPLARLVSYNILKREEHENGNLYRLQPNVRNWTAPLNRGIPAVQRSAKYMKRVVGQLYLALKPRELDDMLEQLSFEGALESSAGTASAGESLTVSDTAPNEPLSISERGIQTASVSERFAAALAQGTVEEDFPEPARPGPLTPTVSRLMRELPSRAAPCARETPKVQSLTVSDSAQLATTAKSTEVEAASSAHARITSPETALAWITEIDLAGALKVAKWSAAWLKLCTQDHEYIRDKLWRRYHEKAGTFRNNDPLSYLYVIAKCDRRMM